MVCISKWRRVENFENFEILKGRDGSYIYESRVAPLKPPKRVHVLYLKLILLILYSLITILCNNMLLLIFACNNRHIISDTDIIFVYRI